MIALDLSFSTPLDLSSSVSSPAAEDAAENKLLWDDSLLRAKNIFQRSVLDADWESDDGEDDPDSKPWRVSLSLAEQTRELDQVCCHNLLEVDQHDHDSRSLFLSPEFHVFHAFHDLLRSWDEDNSAEEALERPLSETCWRTESPELEMVEDAVIHDFLEVSEVEEEDGDTDGLIFINKREESEQEEADLDTIISIATEEALTNDIIIDQSEEDFKSLEEQEAFLHEESLSSLPTSGISSPSFLCSTFIQGHGLDNQEDLIDSTLTEGLMEDGEAYVSMQSPDEESNLKKTARKQYGQGRKRRSVLLAKDPNDDDNNVDGDTLTEVIPKDKLPHSCDIETNNTVVQSNDPEASEETITCDKLANNNSECCSDNNAIDRLSMDVDDELELSLAVVCD